MDSQKAAKVSANIEELQALMAAYATDGRSSCQPEAYRELYAEIIIDLEESKYSNPNPHKTIESFYAHCKMKEMKTYASRREYIAEIYSDILLELKRIQRHAASSRGWKKANDALQDNLSPIRAQWLKAKNFIYAPTPDFENSIKESINSIESWADAGAECNRVIELRQVHHVASPLLFPSPRSSLQSDISS